MLLMSVAQDRAAPVRGTRRVTGGTGAVHGSIRKRAFPCISFSTAMLALDMKHESLLVE
jgi:hypothetical protein